MLSISCFSLVTRLGFISDSNGISYVLHGNLMEYLTTNIELYPIFFRSDLFIYNKHNHVLYSLENWYYKILILMTGNMKNAEIAVDALSVW